MKTQLQYAKEGHKNTEKTMGDRAFMEVTCVNSGNRGAQSLQQEGNLRGT